MGSVYWHRAICSVLVERIFWGNCAKHVLLRERTWHLRVILTEPKEQEFSEQTELKPFAFRLEALPVHCVSEEGHNLWSERFNLFFITLPIDRRRIGRCQTITVWFSCVQYQKLVTRKSAIAVNWKRNGTFIFLNCINLIQFISLFWLIPRELCFYMVGWADCEREAVIKSRFFVVGDLGFYSRRCHWLTVWASWTAWVTVSASFTRPIKVSIPHIMPRAWQVPLHLLPLGHVEASEVISSNVPNCNQFCLNSLSSLGL